MSEDVLQSARSQCVSIYLFEMLPLNLEISTFALKLKLSFTV